MTQIIFKYDFNKDVDNFIRGTRSVNSPKPTKLQEEYILQNGTDYSEHKVKKFLRGYQGKIGFDHSKSLLRLKQSWKRIEVPFISHVEKLFNIPYPSPQITAYLTINQRCTYNIPENYFFVNFASSFPNKTVMHEVLHFYTWQAFHDDLIRAGISESQYNDIKESLTVLLNTEFSEFMEGAYDEGYPQHAEMRERVQELWDKTKYLRKVVFGVFSLPE